MPRETRVLVLVLSALISSGAFAVGDTIGGIVGSVGSGDAPVAGATVTVRHVDTGQTRSVTTGSDGEFRIGTLAVGTYEVKAASAAGETTPETVEVHVGGNTALQLLIGAAMETVEVSAHRTHGLVDRFSTDAGVQLSVEELARLPVQRDIASVAMLAPGVVGGDAGFNALPSFGGASVAENVFYVNGLNVTNLRNGLGGPDVPFDFYEDFQIKTGGYSAEFGRSTGGVVNAVAKSGTNEWRFGANIYYAPESLRSQSRDVRNSEGTLAVANSRDRLDETEVNFEVGGPLIADRLFLYTLVSPRRVQGFDFESSGTRVERDENNLFWGLSLNWLINDSHKLELTAFSDRHDIDFTQRDWDSDADEVSGDPRRSTSRRGGMSAILKYTGQLTDALSVSALFGRTQNDLIDSSPLDANPAIYLTDDGTTFTPIGNFGSDEFGPADDDRTAMRFDFDWDMGDHTLSFGLDREVMDSFEDKTYSGGVYYELHTEDPQDFAWAFHQRTSGEFRTIATAAYVEGTFRLSDVTLTAGVRSDQFENRNGLGGTFVDMERQLAPRFAVAWDLGGDGNDKLYANVGRYYLPVANILNIRLAGAFYADEERFELEGINDDGTPILGAVLDPLFVQFDGEVADPRTIVNQDIEPMYQDEFIAGYAFRFADAWSADINAVYRKLGRAIEDSTPCLPLDAIALERYGIADYCGTISPPYVLTNPGSAMRVFHDFGQGDGLEELRFTAAELGYPEATRKYTALNFSVQRDYHDAWSLEGSYTWSRSSGNYEGTVKSDGQFVQQNAGFTTAFDFPSLLEHADGYLPNDRRHVLKLWGSWGLAPQWQVGWNWLSASGRPVSFLGLHPTDLNAQVYESAAFYRDGEPVPRGSVGRTGWLHQLDLSTRFEFEFGATQGHVRLEVINVLDLENEVGTYEDGELDPIPGDAFPDDLNYGLPIEFQQPRTVLLSAQFRF